MATVKSAWFKHSLAPQFTLSQQTKHTLSILFNSYDHLLLRCCLSLNPFCYIIALFISCLYCCTCIGVLSNVLILESHRHKFKNQRLSAFCWDRITPFHSTELSLKYLIMKSRRYKNWTSTLILNKSYFFLLAFLPTMPCSLFLPLSISLSLTLSSPLLSSFNSIALFSLPSSRIESAWWKQISLQHHNRMADAGKMNPNGFFFSMCSRLNIRPDLQM